MEKFFEVNSKMLFSDEHFLMVKDRGMVKARELNTGDVVYGISGESSLVRSINEIKYN